MKLFFLLLYISNASAFFESYKIAQAYKEQDFETAQVLLKQQLLQDPYNAQVLSNCGDVAYRKGEFSKARAYFQQAIVNAQQQELVELVHSAQFNLGNCYFQEKDFKQAIATYEAILTQYPDDEKALYNKNKAEGLLKEEERKDRDNPLGENSKEQDSQPGRDQSKDQQDSDDQQNDQQKQQDGAGQQQNNEGGQGEQLDSQQDQKDAANKGQGQGNSSDASDNEKEKNEQGDHDGDDKESEANKSKEDKQGNQHGSNPQQKNDQQEMGNDAQSNKQQEQGKNEDQQESVGEKSSVSPAKKSGQKQQTLIAQEDNQQESGEKMDAEALYLQRIEDADKESGKDLLKRMTILRGKTHEGQRNW